MASTRDKLGGVDLLYILSPSYSGSTLLTFVLGQHPNIATIGELKGTSMGDIDEYLCSCGSRILECDFWKRVCDRATEQDLDFQLSDFKTHFGAADGLKGRLANMSVRGSFIEAVRSAWIGLWPGYRDYIDTIVRQNVTLMRIIMSEQAASMFLDGSKDARRLDYFLSAPGFNVKAIRLLRDGRGVSASFAKNESLSFENGIREWMRASDEIDRVIRLMKPADVTVVKYEDFCLNPAATMRQLSGFVGVDDIPVDDEIPLRASHINGNKMRLAGVTEIRLNEVWRERLTKEDLSVFERIAGARNREYGYAA